MLFNLIYRSLRQHALSTVVTAASIALASGLLLTVWVVKTQSQSVFSATNSGFDAVLGARGSKLQLVLNAIFHLEASPGNITAQDYEQIRRHPAVKAAIPIAVGDNFQGWRIVGTIEALFNDVEYSPGKKYAVQAGGAVFKTGTREALVGAYAAKKLGWKVGSTFSPYHGIAFNPEDQHEEVYTVVGVLEPTNTPVDRVIWIPMAGVQTMSGHAAQAANDVSAVLIQLRAATAGMMLDMAINKQGNKLTFAFPIGTIVAELFNKIGWFDKVLTLLAWLVAVVAAGSVLVSIYNSMSSRQRDIAILRALGAKRRTVFGAVVGEAAFIGVFGALAGFGVFVALAIFVANLIQAQTGVVLEPLKWNPVFWWGPSTFVGLCVLGGLVPAFKAYRVPVAETIAPVS
ncbi:ABC transporter permease [Oleiharenicola lentus]|uniref:ABC transporter permease n=1 Tax=Oleiharenicola lentus TaxID=2508720 RepID=UPI003F66607D